MAFVARDLMTPVAVTVRTDTPLLEIVHLFVEAQISGAAVVDEQGVVCGFVSAIDVLTAVDQAGDEDIDDGEAVEELEGLRSLTAREIATPEVAWVSPETAAVDIAQRMHSQGIHRVLVGTDGRAIGMLTAFDLLRAISA